MVYAENLTGAIYLDNQEDIDAYEEVWEALDILALDQSLSIDYLSRRLKKLTDGT